MNKAFYISIILFLHTSIYVNAYDNSLDYAKGEIINNEGDKIGIVNLFQGEKGVLIYINAENLPEGKHGMHFHQVGTCEDTKSFMKSSSHIGAHEPHGYLNPQGPHAGNLPNLFAHKSGKAEVEIYTELVSINGHNDKPALLDKDGSTLIIHESGDDHFTQPIGGSGKRIACAVIKSINR